MHQRPVTWPRISPSIGEHLNDCAILFQASVTWTFYETIKYDTRKLYIQFFTDEQLKVENCVFTISKQGLHTCEYHKPFSTKKKSCYKYKYKQFYVPGYRV